MSKEHYWVCGRVDQYVNGFYRDDEPEKMTLMPARWETTVGLLNSECNDYVLHVDYFENIKGYQDIGFGLLGAS